MYILFDICEQDGVTNIFRLVKTGLEIIRLIVPVGLVLMTGIDIFKKVINPDDKDGQKKILTRIIASILVFFVPVMVRFVIKLVDIGGGTVESGSSCEEAWRKA